MSGHLQVCDTKDEESEHAGLFNTNEDEFECAELFDVKKMRILKLLSHLTGKMKNQRGIFLGTL